MIGQFTPAGVAGGTIRAYRACAVGAADNTWLESNANDKDLVGVADGSTEDPLIATAVHATSGNEVRLQPGVVVLIEFGGTVTAGKEVMSDADGKAVLANSTATATIGVALEDGADGKISKIQWRPNVDLVGT